jgi:hypothetical protein
VWSILKSPVWTTEPIGVSMISPAASGIEWETEKNSTAKGPTLAVSPAAPRQLGAEDRHIELAEEERHRANVVLVAVRQEDGLEA